MPNIKKKTSNVSSFAEALNVCICTSSNLIGWWYCTVCSETVVYNSLICSKAKVMSNVLFIINAAIGLLGDVQTRILRPGEWRVSLNRRKIRMMEKNSRMSALSTWWANSCQKDQSEKLEFSLTVFQYVYSVDYSLKTNKNKERREKLGTCLQQHVGVEGERRHQINNVDGRLQKIAFVGTCFKQKYKFNWQYNLSFYFF